MENDTKFQLNLIHGRNFLPKWSINLIFNTNKIKYLHEHQVNENKVARGCVEDWLSWLDKKPRVARKPLRRILKLQKALAAWPRGQKSCFSNRGFRMCQAYTTKITLSQLKMSLIDHLGSKYKDKRNPTQMSSFLLDEYLVNTRKIFQSTRTFSECKKF